MQYTRSPSLDRFQQRLLSTQAGTFQEDHYLLPWCPPAVAELLDRHAVEMKPGRIEYRPGRPLHCHEEALTYATLNKEARAWWGFSLYEGLWWVHSWCMEEGGAVLIDHAEPSSPAHYAGIPWGRELYTALTKHPVTPADLPPVLRRSILEALFETRLGWLDARALNFGCFT